MASLELQRDPTRDREPGDLVRLALDQQVQLNSQAGPQSGNKASELRLGIGPPLLLPRARSKPWTALTQTMGCLMWLWSPPEAAI